MIEVSAPSNIALIKYMGKSDPRSNRPTNASLSYTLEKLRTTVTIERISGPEDEWMPLLGPAFSRIELSAKGKDKFLSHLKRMKEVLQLDGCYRVTSANNFPADAGLASSASSFAALTLACYEEKKRQNNQFVMSLEKLADLSRQGSGSSCRSFFSPWALWDQEGAREVSLNTGKLQHFVLVFESRAKAVSSSEAHLRVTTSPLFKKDSSGLSRIERAEMRLKNLISALQENHWTKSFEICWDEFWDMHELFHTSAPPFTYLNDDVREVLKGMKQRWQEEGVGPIITLDAGPNIHCLFQEKDVELAKSWQHQFQPREFVK